MTEDRMTMLFFEMFTGLPRQGPGDRASTLRAWSMVPDVGPHTRVLDLGCGTGLQTRVLARQSPARFVAIDHHAPYIEELIRHADADGLTDRVEARVGDMRALDLTDESFDVIWCEGAIYVVGFEVGLREWRRLLVPGGHLVVSEACWTRPDAPRECIDFWLREYPAIRDAPALLRAIHDCDYDVVGHFTLPASSWWDDYYRPLQQHVIEFRDRHRREPDAQEMADSVQHEIDVWRAYSEYYSYEFFVIRKRGPLR
jgi:SAM-dependent methyltransferase